MEEDIRLPENLEKAFDVLEETGYWFFILERLCVEPFKES